MTLNFRLRCSPYQNTPSIDFIDNKLANVPRVLTKSSGSLAPTFKSPFYSLTLDLVPIVSRYTDKNL